MKSFNNLSIEKREHIINSSMHVFADNGYKKAYMSEIAKRAEVSKPTLFYHFKTKQDLYFFLLDVAFEEITENVDVLEVYEQHDFFECLKVSTSYKMEVLSRRPSLMKFMTKFYFETDDDVIGRKEEYMAKSADLRSKLVFEDLDTSKFKDTVDPCMVMDMLLKWTDGYIAHLERSSDRMSDSEISIFYNKLCDDFLELIEMLRINFYKKQYLED